MSFKENAYQQLSITDSFSGLTARAVSYTHLDVYKRQRYTQHKSHLVAA